MAKAWAEYREEQGIYSFADMIIEFLEKGKVPPLEVLIVDEAQDLAELNWRLIEKLMAATPMIYIAGDDDQAIYEWNGARPDRFISMQGKTIVLEQSYRIPKTVHALANKISSRIHKRFPKVYKPKEERGQVTRLHSIDGLDMNNEFEITTIIINNYIIPPL